MYVLYFFIFFIYNQQSEKIENDLLQNKNTELRRTIAKKTRKMSKPVEDRLTHRRADLNLDKLFDAMKIAIVSWGNSGFSQETLYKKFSFRGHPSIFFYPAECELVKNDSRFLESKTLAKQLGLVSMFKIDEDDKNGLWYLTVPGLYDTSILGARARLF